MSGKPREPVEQLGVEPAVRAAHDDDDTLDQVFQALANGTRRQILDLLRDEPRTTGDLCARFPALDRCTTMQHLRVLERAGLVVAHRRGRERWNHLDVLPIQLLHDRWIGDYARSAVVALLAGLKADLEADLEAVPAGGPT